MWRQRKRWRERVRGRLVFYIQHTYVLVHGDGQVSLFYSVVISQQVLVSHPDSYTQFPVETFLGRSRLEHLDGLKLLAGSWPGQLHLTVPTSTKHSRKSCAMKIYHQYTSRSASGVGGCTHTHIQLSHVFPPYFQLVSTQCDTVCFPIHVVRYICIYHTPSAMPRPCTQPCIAVALG